MPDEVAKRNSQNCHLTVRSPGLPKTRCLSYRLDPVTTVASQGIDHCGTTINYPPYSNNRGDFLDALFGEGSHITQHLLLLVLAKRLLCRHLSLALGYKLEKLAVGHLSNTFCRNIKSLIA